MSSSSMGVLLHYKQAVELACHGSVQKCREKLRLIEALDRNSELSPSEVQLVHFILHLRERNTEAASASFQIVQESPDVARNAIAYMESISGTDPAHIAAFRKTIDSSMPAESRRQSKASWVGKGVGVLVCTLLISAVGLLAADPWGLVWRERIQPVGSNGEEIASNVADGAESLDLTNDVASPPESVSTDFAHDGSIQDAVGRLIVTVTYLSEDGTEHVVPIGHGTAFAISADGLMMTNRHVIEPGRQSVEDEEDPESLVALSWDLVVAFGPNESDWYPARVEKSSAYIDMAIVRVNRTFQSPFRFASTFTQGEDITVWGYPGVVARYLDAHAGNKESISRSQINNAKLFNESHGTTLADWLATSPGGFSLVATRGIISAIHDADDEQYLLTDAAIHEGNSGGPMLNRNREVVGLVTWGSTEAESVGSGITWRTFKDELASFPAIPVP